MVEQSRKVLTLKAKLECLEARDLAGIRHLQAYRWLFCAFCGQMRDKGPL